MKKKQVNAIFIDETRRKKKIFSYVAIIVLIAVLSVASLAIYFKKNQDQYVNYSETSDLKYKVKLRENEFFEHESLEEGQNYISELIEGIDADFKYNLAIEEPDIDYEYSYKIEALIDVKDATSDKSIYKYKDLIKEEDIRENNSNNPLEIVENVKVNYNKYNSLIKKFIRTYDLEKTESMLYINMSVNVNGNCGKTGAKKQDSVITLEIPLTTKTVDINVTTDLINNNQEDVLVCKNHDNKIVLFLIFAIIGVVIMLYLFTEMFKYMVKTRTPQSIYEAELRKILNNYKSYIQKVNNEFDFKGYQTLKVDTFEDMLEIRDTVASPILMVENKDRNETSFLITSNTKILYCYTLEVKKEGAVHEG